VKEGCGTFLESGVGMAQKRGDVKKETTGLTYELAYIKGSGYKRDVGRRLYLKEKKKREESPHLLPSPWGGKREHRMQLEDRFQPQKRDRDPTCLSGEGGLKMRQPYRQGERDRGGVLRDKGGFLSHPGGGV